MAAAQLVCAVVCAPVANIGLAEAGGMAALVVVLLVSAFWPARSA